jgi:hypothetical protein
LFMTSGHSGALRYTRHGSRRFTRFRWQAATIRYCALAIGGLFALNWVYQVVKKPGELFAPISTAFFKSPESTWQSYGPLFEQHSTPILSPEFLAALAQLESNGNPIARTYWRWQWSWNPFEVYRPASTALGMFQLTDGTFNDARKYCIRDHQVVSEGPWHELRSCWFNNLYTRTIPSHATEMTAAYLQRNVDHVLDLRRRTKVSVAHKQKLAAVIHLCGLRRGETFVAREFRTKPAERCGTHSLVRYLKQVDAMTKTFGRLRMGSQRRSL